MKELPLVSVLIPCYNHEQFLDDILQSITGQEYKKIELLVCDDCSTDKSYEVLMGWLPKLKDSLYRVEILRNETNQGVTRTLNRLLGLAQGEYIKAIASDDAMTPDAISTMVFYMEANVECGVVISNGVRVEESQHYPNFQSSNLIYTQAPDFSPEGFFERVARHNEVFAPGAMLRTQVFLEHGLYDERIPVEDLEYWLRLLSQGQTLFGYIHRPLIYYRVNSESMSSMVNNAQLEGRRKRMHHAVMDTLKKHKEAFRTGIYEEICLLRILDERRFAVNKGLLQWDRQLQQEWKAFDTKQNVALQQRIRLTIRYLRTNVKKMIGWKVDR